MMNSYNLIMVKELTDSDPEFIREMVQAFIDEIPNDLEAMNDAIANENAGMTYQIAHKMKPNLQLFGMHLSPEIQKLEAWRDTHLKKEDILLPARKINDEVVQVIEELKRDFNIA